MTNITYNIQETDLIIIKCNTAGSHEWTDWRNHKSISWSRLWHGVYAFAVTMVTITTSQITWAKYNWFSKLLYICQGYCSQLWPWHVRTAVATSCCPKCQETTLTSVNHNILLQLSLYINTCQM